MIQLVGDLERQTGKLDKFSTLAVRWNKFLPFSLFPFLHILKMDAPFEVRADYSS
jgi:hypothetical protein